MLSQSILKKEKSHLQEEASNISILKKQITKEAEIDASVQLSISQKIQNLKQNAGVLAKKLENEKHKNSELETIIRHMKGKMEQQRLEEANFRDNINSENLNSLENKFKKLQYDLGQLNGKVNRLSENVEQKRNKISQNRTQRVIDSGIFRNIQKQLIDSELTFKKLLIEKIRYQKEYEKLIQEYNSLKQKADNYYIRKDSTRIKTSNELTPQGEGAQSLLNFKKKFVEMDMGRPNNRSITMVKYDEDINLQEQNRIMCIKKMLIQTGLQNCNDLIYYLKNIQEVNQKSFNQMNIYADQSNQIEKYLAKAEEMKRLKKIKFNERQDLTKQQIITQQYKEKKQKIITENNIINNQMKQFTNLFESDNFKQFLKNLSISPVSFMEEGYVNFDTLKQTLQLIERNIQQYLHHPCKIQEEKNSTARNNNGPEKLDQLINRVRKSDECLKVMKKQEFKQQYQKMIKNNLQKVSNVNAAIKKKSFQLLKK